MQEVTIAPATRGLPKAAFLHLDAQALCLVLSTMLLMTFAVVKATDPDYWWHLRTGQLIAQTHTVPNTDTFSFTADGKHWLVHEWLSELIIYGLQSAGGYALNVLVFGGVALGALLVTYRTVVRMGVSRWVALLFFIWAGIMSQAYWLVRPQVFSWLFFALFLTILLEHRRRGTSLWLLPVLMVLWANMHPGSMFGVAVVGLYVVAAAAERFFWKQPHDLMKLALVLVACVAAICITPQPGQLLLYPLHYIKPGNADLALISEWKSPDFHAKAYLPLATAFLALIAMGVFDKKQGLFLPLLTLVFSFLALQSLRHVPLFAIVFFMVAAARSADLRRWAGAQPMQDAAPSRTAINLAIVGFVAMLLLLMVTRLPNQLHATARTDGSMPYPREGVEYMRVNYPTARIFATYYWGGYVMNEMQQARVFIDGRADFYGSELMQDYMDVSFVTDRWREVLSGAGVEVIVVQANSSLARALDDETSTWRRVFTGPVEAVFARN